MAWQAQGEHDGVRAQLHDYIYDYLVKMNYKDTAHAFADESKITTTADDSQSNKNYDTLAASLDSIDKSRNDHPQMSPHSNKKGAPAGLPHVKVPIDAPGGFLYEWWVIFWDIFTAKHNRSTNKDAMAYVEAQQRLKQQQMFSAFQQQQLMRLQQHAAQQVYQAQEQPSLQQAMRANVPPGSQQIARGQTSEDMMMDTNAQAPENTPNSKRTQEDSGQMSSPSPTASPNKRQRLSPPDGIQTAASSAMDEQQQAAMMNRRRASVQGLQAGAAAANKQQTGQTPRMTALSLQQQMLQNQYQMNIRSIQNSNISEAQKQSAILQYKEKLVNQQKMAMADAAINQSSAAGATASPKNHNVSAAMLPPNMPQAQVGSNPQVPGAIPGQPGMPMNQLQYQQMIMEQQKRNQQMMMGRMSQQNMQPGMMGMSPRTPQQQPGPMSPAPNSSVPGQPGGRNTPHISSQVLPSPSIVASNTTPGGNMQGGQFVATSGGQDMNNVSDQIKASQMDLEKRIAMTHAPMNAGVTGSAGPPGGGPPKAPVGHMMARAPMMAGYPGMGHPAAMGMMNGMMPGVGGMAGIPAGMMAGMPGGPAIRGVAPQATNAAQFMQQQQQMYNMGMVQAMGPEAQMRAQQAQIAQQAQAAAAMALRNRPPPQANGMQQQQANAMQMAMNNAAANAAATPTSKPSDTPKPKASPAKSNQAKAAAANTPSATPVPTQIVSPEQAAAVSKPTDAPTPQQVANAAAQATPNATPTISSQDNKAAAAAAVSKPTDNRNNETSNFLTDDPLMFDNEVPLLDDNFDLDVFFNNTDEYSFNQT